MRNKENKQLVKPKIKREIKEIKMDYACRIISTDEYQGYNIRDYIIF